ncbi:MAG: 16S rRNA processing protein RimM [Bacilli bacterium]|nr:16S rRNA processing protein RimM [Bacilli bacterium]
MNEYILIGKIVNTHALKGEVRLISDFEYKEKVFVINNELYIGKEKNKETIETYRKHKNFDMVKFKGIETINEVIKYKGQKVYILKETLNLGEDEILIDELIDMQVVFNNEILGEVEEYRNDSGNKIIKVSGKYIPYNKNFIEKIDKKERKIYYKNIEGLI